MKEETKFWKERGPGAKATKIIIGFFIPITIWYVYLGFALHWAYFLTAAIYLASIIFQVAMQVRTRRRRFEQQDMTELLTRVSPGMKEQQRKFFFGLTNSPPSLFGLFLPTHFFTGPVKPNTFTNMKAVSFTQPTIPPSYTGPLNTISPVKLSKEEPDEK